MAAISQYYSDNLRQEVRKGQHEKVLQGWMPCGVPYGYTNRADRAEPIMPHPEKAKLVVRVFELYAQGGMTFHMIADQLVREGFVHRPSQPRMSPGSMSYMLANRFYVGDIVWKGEVYPGKHQPLIDRRTFQRCREMLKGKNRRTNRLTHTFANGLFLCQYCGSMITGERIRRKLSDGSVRLHMYYRCANNHQADDHPRVRWREADLEQVVIAELESLRLPATELTDWFREALDQALGRLRRNQAQQRRSLARRKVDLEKQQDRLLALYLEDQLDTEAYRSMAAVLQGQMKEIEAGLSGANGVETPCSDIGGRAFDFTQNAVEVWRQAGGAGKQRILRAISSRRTLSDTGLHMAKREPFNLLAERLSRRTGHKTTTGGRPAALQPSS